MKADVKELVVKLTDRKIVHSVYDGTPTLQVSGGIYYNLINLDEGIWLVTFTCFAYNTEVVICYGNTVNNIVTESGSGSYQLGNSGAGIVQLTQPTTIQMYCTNNANLYRFKAEAFKLA